MAKSAGGNAASPRLQHHVEAQLEGDAVYLNVDDKYVYAACDDMKVRVWSRDDWQLVAELGETSSPPLAVHVDDNQVYATCEKRVYVWNKNSWGMIGWFELSYSAVTSTLRGDSLYVGAKEGRLVSIKKESHDTSSWQLFKADINNLWGDGEIICTSTSKDEAVVWKLESEGAPTEIKRLEKKDKGTKVVGNSHFIITGLTTADIKLWDRVDWSQIKSLPALESNVIGSMWANDLYLVVSSNTARVSIWDLRKGVGIGTIKLEGTKIFHVRVDKQHIFLATPDKILIVSITLSQQPLDLSAEDGMLYAPGLLKTSPYDVLESVLDLQKQGDAKIQNAEYHEAVADYEHALQLLIDNTHALLEVPSEREALTNELNDRLGLSLLRAKISEIEDLTKEIMVISDEFDREGRSSKDEVELERIWNSASRAIKESRVLAEAQAGHILSYQLSHATDNLEQEWHEAQEKFELYQEKITEALTLTQNVRSEWRWLERKRSSLQEREGFLTNAITKLEKSIVDAEEDAEVVEILALALNEFVHLKDQIGRILSVSTTEPQEVVLTKDETSSAIKGLLGVLTKRKEQTTNPQNIAEFQRETKQLTEAIEQALQAAQYHKMKDEIQSLSKELAILKGVEGSDSGKKEAPVEASNQAPEESKNQASEDAKIEEPVSEVPPKKKRRRTKKKEV
ncbi:MAG: hypothetical protein ACFFDR_07760 [Candidatus Thorarchaeota archaeon]